ncbi:MAG TPA: hypothetical protein VIM11_20610 [Tepidisphaeraceae bacterium]|jgi:hypothetical protein
MPEKGFLSRACTAAALSCGVIATLIASAARPGKGEGVLTLLAAGLLTLAAFVLAVMSLLVSPPGRRFKSVLGFSATAIGCIAVGGLFSTMRATRNISPCTSHLKQIGVALILYSEGHDGNLPASLENLVSSFDTELSAEVLVCYTSGDTPAEGAGTALVANLARSGHNSYIYLGSGKKLADFGNDDVIAYDRPGNHGPDGVNILAGDGHTEWVTLPGLQEALARRTVTSRPASQSAPSRQVNP